MPAAASSSAESPFLKQLASSDRRKRDAALESLRTYLQRPTPFTDLELLKLWKGLFFCMWMSDKPLTQQRLARSLADLLHAVQGPENFLGLARAFWTTIAREWSGIDALRMDKFLYLVRCYVKEGFEVVARQRWGDEVLLERYLAVLREGPLSVGDAKVPNGLRHHVVELWVEELDKVDGSRTVPLEKVMEPLRALGRESLTKSVRQRVKEALADERLADWQAVRDDDEDVDSEEGVETAETTDGKAGEDEGFAGFAD